MAYNSTSAVGTFDVGLAHTTSMYKYVYSYYANAWFGARATDTQFFARIVFKLTMQVALLRQGLVRHSLISVSHCVPVTPAGQEQL